MSFDENSQLAIEYVKRLRAKNIEYSMNTNAKYKYVNDRIKQLVTNVAKNSVKLEDIRNKLDEMTIERDKYKDEVMAQNLLRKSWLYFPEKIIISIFKN